MEDKAILLQKLIPDIIAILLILICSTMILCGRDGIFRHILSALVGYYFGQKAIPNKRGM